LIKTIDVIWYNKAKKTYFDIIHPGDVIATTAGKQINNMYVDKNE
jgi:hypothetical protein